jgi:chitodextrinase
MNKLIKNKLASSPKRDDKTSSKTIISLPNGEGKLENYHVYKNSVMNPVLAAKYPEIKSFVAVGIDNPSATAYFSISPLGFKSMTLYADQSAVFIEPVSSDLKTYTAYKKSDKKAALDAFECRTIDQVTKNLQPTNGTNIVLRGADDGKVRTLRLALACTAEYTAYFGSSIASTMASMNNTITRINGVFERDFGVKLILVANNDALIYTNPVTDPYSDYSTKYNWCLENNSNLTSIIGASNYDIGHLLGAGPANSGDAGGTGTVCMDLSKGRGYSCAYSGNYQGDSFDIQFVAHEMGHQLGAYHTFTYKLDNNIAQMEPGSGSTIMSYGGSSMQDYQDHRDAYFHAISIQQVTDYIKTLTCPVVISTGNAVPIVNAGLDYSIPIGTPFMLTGSATDANTTDVLTYTWEEMDLGTTTTTEPTATNTTGPLFRSFIPSASAARYLPTITTILAGATTTPGLYIPSEALPGVTRTLNFRLTVRDNRAGGSANNADDMVITVDGNSGPFAINSQNSAVSYAAGTTQTINWAVAGTNANGVNCATVDILLSTNGGNTFAITLLTATPNNGAANVVIPNITGTANRIMVKGTNQIFFDINNANFTITGSGTADTTAPTATALSASGTTISGTNLFWTAATDNVGISGYDVYQNGVLKTTVTATSLAVSDLSASTAYSFYVKAKDAAGNLSAASNTVNVATSGTADTTAPAASILSLSGTTTSGTNLSWTAATDNVGVTGYNVYQNGVLKTTVTATSLAVSGLSASTAYSFYVKAKDTAGNLSAGSNTVNVTTSATADNTAPTTSTLSLSGTTTSGTNLSWTSATDNVGVAGYDVYQNGVLKTTVTATSLAVSGLSASTAYSFYVKAKDAAGNLSATSNTANATTLTPADTAAPTATMLSTSGTTTSGTNLSWTAATDNVGVTGYNVYQNGVLKTTVTATSLAVSGLSVSTAYSFYVKAKDAAGNLSASSNTANVTTLANTSVGYCSSYGSSTAKEYINKVQIGSINNVSGNNNGYGNYTSMSTNLATGTSNTIVITPAWNGATLNERKHCHTNYCFKW